MAERPKTEDSSASSGGIRIRSLEGASLQAKATQVALCSDAAPYEFKQVVLDHQSGPIWLNSAMVFVYAGRDDSAIRCAEQALAVNDALWVRDGWAALSVTRGRAEFVVATPVSSSANDPGTPTQAANDARRRTASVELCGQGRVLKPWGHERWLHPQGFGLALKALCLRAGCRTSLQYHRKKHETIFSVRGRVRLHHARTPRSLAETESAGADELIADMTASDFDPGRAFEIEPGCIHRLEAIDDIVLLETSTLELDDVVRVSDDQGRPDGRIESEHDSQHSGPKSLRTAG